MVVLLLSQALHSPVSRAGIYVCVTKAIADRQLNTSLLLLELIEDYDTHTLSLRYRIVLFFSYKALLYRWQIIEPYMHAYLSDRANDLQLAKMTVFQMIELRELFGVQ
jgi:hypothetical protein